MTRRSYAGGVKAVTLTAPVTDISTSLPVSNLDGVPTGADGPFSVVVSKGEANEEKMLVSTAAGGLMTVSVRGYDGTLPQSHPVDAEVRLVGTAIDFDEANRHVEATEGVHGLASLDTVVGAQKVQTIFNKVIDGDDNTIRNVPLVGQPEILGAITDEVVAREVGDAERYTKTEADGIFTTTGDLASAIEEHAGAADPHEGYILDDGNGKLKETDLPRYNSGRWWHARGDVVTVRDPDPGPEIAGITPFILLANASQIVYLVTLTVRGFTTNGADGDTARFSISLATNDPPPGGGYGWMGWGGDNPTMNQRMGGNISVAAEGMTLSAIFRSANTGISFRGLMTKISGTPNVTNHADTVLTVVQLV